jgi:hypothetical protein
MDKYHIKLAGLIGLLLCPFLGWAAPSQDDTAEERWFQIELILFKHQGNQDPKEAEKWPEIVGIHLPDDLVELSEPVAEPAVPEPEAAATPPAPTWQAQSGTEPLEPQPDAPLPYELLGEDEYQLEGILGSLKRSSRFAPLLHLAWRQITVDEAHTKPVLLYTGMTDPLPEPVPPAEEAPLPAPGTPGADEFPPPLVPATEEDANIGPINPELVGTVRLSVSRYLHLEADLIYRTPVAQAMAVPVPDLDLWYDRPYATLYEPQGPAFTLKTWQAIRGFRLFESRRMRSTEIHYLDHPFFGLIALVTPYEPPKAETPEEAPTPATEIRTLD